MSYRKDIVKLIEPLSRDAQVGLMRSLNRYVQMKSEQAVAAETERVFGLLFPWTAHSESCREHTDGPDTCDCRLAEAIREARRD